MGLFPFSKKNQKQDELQNSMQLPPFQQDNIFGGPDFSQFNLNQPQQQINNLHQQPQQLPFSSFDQNNFQNSFSGFEYQNFGTPQYNQQYQQQQTQQNQDIKATIDVEIDEKLKPIQNNINDILNWKDKIDEKINQLEETISDLNSRVNSLYDILAKKVEEYDKGLKENNVELQALHRLIRTLLPAISESTKELKETIEELKALKDDLKK